MIIILCLVYIGSLLQLTSSFQTTPPPPAEYKLAAIEYLTNRVSTQPLNKRKRKENDTIKEILYNNKYDTAVLNKISRTNNEGERKTGRTNKDGRTSRMLEHKKVNS
jgi:hypothetical protein